MTQAIRPALLALFLVTIAPGLASTALGQGQGGTEQLGKILEDIDKVEERKKERLRPPIEFFRSQVLPNDILPYVKANHWAMVGLEMRANHEDYEGSLQTRPIGLLDQPYEMIYRRDARLIKGQRARLTMPIFLPAIPKEIGFQLVRPDAIRPDEDWPASLRVLEPHQQLVMVLSKASTGQFARWSNFKAGLPAGGRKDDPLLMDKQRYYRMVLPLEPEKPLLPAHPLTWASISHIIWDGLDPEALGAGQQQAMLDWLHWGGQLVIVGGAGPAFAPLRESFLASFLPADPSGENVQKSSKDLSALSDAYPPPSGGLEPDELTITSLSPADAWEKVGRRYRAASPIPSAERKPLFVTGLTPRPGAIPIPLGGENDPPLGVEWKVGRGRVLMLAVSLAEPDLMTWTGFDTFVRRVVLRRPEEKQLSPLALDPSGQTVPPQYEPLNGNDLTTVRYLSRDLGAPTRSAVDEDGVAVGNRGYYGVASESLSRTEHPVGEWLDSAELPRLSRTMLEKASGIEIPGRAFVLKVILAYILILVPLNYVICRYLLGRREWAWIMVPTLSLAFAIGVERAAAYDVGYDSSCDEVDLIETHVGYPRGHVTRFASLYSTGRVKFNISYPNDPTALALPLSTGRALRGEDATQSSFQTQPVPTLAGFQVQPRSLSMFRAEQMASLPGTVALSAEGAGPSSVVNDLGLDLNDAVIVEVRPQGTSRSALLGKVASGAKVLVPPLEDDRAGLPEGASPLEPGPFLNLLRQASIAARPEEVGELRLIAWADKPIAGQSIDPPVDRQRGFTLVVAHLRPAPLPDPASPRYNVLALGPERAPTLLKVLSPNTVYGRPMIGLPNSRRGPIPTSLTPPTPNNPQPTTQPAPPAGRQPL